MRKLILGLYCPINQDLTLYFNKLQGIGEVRLISARQENLGPIDMLIYPDGMGILPDTPGLAHGRRIFTPTNPINPFFYSFWNERPFQNIIEERDIPIIGVGDAACMLYSELGGKLIIASDGTPMLLEGLNDAQYDYGTLVGEPDVIGFNNKKVYGAMTSIMLSTQLNRAIEDVISNDNTEDEVPVTKSPPPSSPTNKLQIPPATR